MVLNIHRNHKGTGERGRRGGMGEEGGYIPIATLSPPLRMTPVLRWTAIRVTLMFH